MSGDLTCQCCGADNPAWFADNALWNEVMGGPEATDDPGGVLCPNCFAFRAGRRLRLTTETPASIDQAALAWEFEQALAAFAVYQHNNASVRCHPRLYGVFEKNPHGKAIQHGEPLERAAAVTACRRILAERLVEIAERHLRAAARAGA